MRGKNSVLDDDCQPGEAHTIQMTFHAGTLMTAEQIALVLDCSTHTVYRMWKSGKLAITHDRYGRNRSRFADVQAVGRDQLSDASTARLVKV